MSEAGKEEVLKSTTRMDSVDLKISFDVRLNYIYEAMQEYSDQRLEEFVEFTKSKMKYRSDLIGALADNITEWLEYSLREFKTPTPKA